MKDSKKITDGVLFTVIFMLLMLGTFIPVLAIICMFLLPVPFVLYTARHNIKPAFLMYAAAILLTVLLATLFSLPLTVTTGLGGILLGYSVYKGLSAYETWARGTFGFIIGMLFTFIYSQVLLGVNWINDLRQMMTDSVEMSLSILPSMGVPGEELEQLEQMMYAQVDYMVQLLPVWLVLTAALAALVSQWISYKIMNRLEDRNLYFPPFRELQLPASLIWIYLIAILLMLIDTDPAGTFSIMVQNVVMLVGLFMIIQGFSFIFYYAHHKNWSKAIPVLSVVVTLLFPGIFIILVRVLGVLDIGFKLRDRIEKKNND
jgi:uncharacterized protein YybS (DUF2232 family)